MLLSDRDIFTELKAGGLQISPLSGAQIQPASVDLHLGTRLYAYRPGRVRPVSAERGSLPQAHLVPFGRTSGYVLQPGGFVLGSTAERVTLPAYLAAQVDGRSTTARLGLAVHLTAGWVDPGFSGDLTLELANLGKLPLRLTHGMGIAQLLVFRCSSPAQRPYGSPGLGSRYQDQQGPVPARAPA